MNDVWLDIGLWLQEHSKSFPPLAAYPGNAREFFSILNDLYEEDLLRREILAAAVDELLAGREICVDDFSAYLMSARLTAAIHQVSSITVPYKGSPILNQSLAKHDHNDILRWLLIDHWELFAWDWWLKLVAATLTDEHSSFYPSL